MDDLESSLDKTNSKQDLVNSSISKSLSIEDNNNICPREDGLLLRQTVHAMSLAQLENLLFTFDVRKLIKFLRIVFPQYVKNKTFNLTSTGHKFHSITGYLPIKANSKRRKQLTLIPEKLKIFLESSKNHSLLYRELRDDMIDDDKCPCELFLPRRERIEKYLKEYNTKIFDDRPERMSRSDDFDKKLSRYGIEWKKTLQRRLPVKKKSETFVKPKILIALKDVSTLDKISGASIVECQHEYICREEQTRAGDEMISFVSYCIKCSKKTIN